jgi:hypothetical protein
MTLSIGLEVVLSAESRMGSYVEIVPKVALVQSLDRAAGSDKCIGNRDNQRFLASDGSMLQLFFKQCVCIDKVSWISEYLLVAREERRLAGKHPSYLSRDRRLHDSLDRWLDPDPTGREQHSRDQDSKQHCDDSYQQQTPSTHSVTATLPRDYSTGSAVLNSFQLTASHFSLT